MEPTFLDKLPVRFRSRFRENLVTLGFVVAAFVISPRCGPYAIVVFFSIVWAAFALFLVSRMIKAQPRRPTWAFVVLGLLLALWGYPIVVGWWTLNFRGDGALAFMLGNLLYLVFVIVERRTILPTLFGGQRSNPIKDWRAVRAAQTTARAERSERVTTLTDSFRDHK